jgi:hypothetical protein
MTERWAGLPLGENTEHRACHTSDSLSLFRTGESRNRVLFRYLSPQVDTVPWIVSDGNPKKNTKQSLLNLEGSSVLFLLIAIRSGVQIII